MDKRAISRWKGLVLYIKRKKCGIKASQNEPTPFKAVLPIQDKISFEGDWSGLSTLVGISDDNQRILHYGYGSGIVRLSLGKQRSLEGRSMLIRKHWCFPVAT